MKKEGGALVKKRIEHFSTSWRTIGPTPKRAAQASTSTAGFLAALNRVVMRLTTCAVTSLLGMSKWSSMFRNRLLIGAADPVEVPSTSSSNGGAEWGAG